MAQLLQAGVGCVVIKCGAAGALVQQQQDKQPLSVPGFPVVTEGTVGAGDAFNAGLLYAVAQGQDVPAATRFANGVATLVLNAQQGVLGGPTLSDVHDFLYLHP